MTAWWYLLAAGGVEIVMAMALKASQDWTKLTPSLLGLAAALASIFLLTRALRDLPLGTAYAIWTGIGSAGVVAAGILLLGESVTAERLLCLVLVITDSIGLRLQSA